MKAPRPARSSQTSPIPDAARRRAHLLGVAALGIGLLGAAVFLPVRHFAFVAWDDPLYVTENPQVLGGLTWTALKWALTAGGDFYWHPLTWISHMLDVQVYGLEAGGHHLTNLAIHLAASLLLLGALARMTGAPGRSAFVAAVFAVHPLHVESVAWVAERKDVLSGLFWMATLVAYAFYAERPDWRRWSAVLACFVLGLMSKPMVVTLPLVLLLLDIWPLGRVALAGPAAGPGVGSASGPGMGSAVAAVGSVVGSAFRRIRPVLLEKLPFFLLSLLAGIATVVYQRQADAVRSLATFPLARRLGNALVSYATYLRQSVWPSGLAGFYPYPTSLSPWAVAAAGLVLVAISTLVWRARHRTYLVVGWVWFLVTLLPVIGIIQVGDQAMADRFMYIPIVGLLLIAAWGMPDLAERVMGRRMLALTATAVVLVLTVAASVQVHYWRDSETLWRRAVAVTRDNQRAHANLGILYAKQGRLEEAAAELTEAVRIVPGAADLHNRIGAVRLQQGKVAEAREAFATAARLWPGYPDAHNNLGTALEREGLLAEATAEYGEAVRLKPDYAIARDNLATALAQQGRLEEAIREGREAVRSDPRFAQARNNLGLMLLEAGRLAEAAAEFGETVRIAPDYANAHAHFADACRLLGRFEDASREYREALRLEPRRPEWHYSLALTLERLGDRPDAAAHLQAALQMAPDFDPARRALDAMSTTTTAPASR